MNTLTLTAFLIITFGILNVLDMSILDFILDIFKLFESKNENINKKIKKANENKKDKWLIKLIKETKEILNQTNKIDKFSNVCLVAIFSMIFGVYISVYIKNYFLVPVLAIGFLTLPFQYIKLTSISYKKAITQELEVSLSMITTSYIRNENIMIAINENINNIKAPIKNVFREFLLETEYINSDVTKALLNLKEKINDDIFKEWIDVLVLCQNNVSLKNTLSPIVSKLSDLRVLSAEINNNMYAPLKEFVTMLILVYGNIPLLYVLNKEWYKTLMNTIYGKLVIVIIVIVTFISFTGIMKLTKPIESSVLKEN